MKIYTKTGDAGDTGLIGGKRTRKYDLRIEAYGTVDELNAAIGLARTETEDTDLDALLSRIQNELFDLGAELANPRAAQEATIRQRTEQIATLEVDIDRLESELAPLRQFILPGGARLAAHLHLSRTICRRAERRAVQLADEPEQPTSPQAITYLNRLSDLLFVMARVANHRAGQPDVPWEQS